MVTKRKMAKSTTDIKKVVGAQVRRLRVEAKMTQQGLADQCDIFRTYMSRIEHGTANPTVTVLAALALALKVPVMELFNE
jgi:transcriptional regulator with XRE-family HTH domain